MSEPTGGQGLREAIKDTLRLYGIRGEQLGSLRPGSVADALLAGPLAALIADADNWRRATTGDPTEPEPLAMQARELLVRNRELEATVARVRELAEELDLHRRVYPARGIYADRIRGALTGEPQP